MSCLSSYHKTFFRNQQEIKVLSTVAKMKLSSKRETQATFHHAVAPQATENKLTRGNHREQMLSTTTSRWEGQGGWKWSSHSLQLGGAGKGRFLFAPLASQQMENIFSQFVVSFCYAIPSRKQELRNLRESRKICCSSPVTANSAQTYFKRALGPPWSTPLSSKRYLTAKDHHSLVTFRADSSCSSRYVIYSRANQNGRFHLVSDHCQGLPGPY